LVFGYLAPQSFTKNAIIIARTIEPRALRALTAFQKGNELSAEITARVTVNTATFEIITDRNWHIPALEDDAFTVINLQLRIVNQAATGIRFNKFDSVRLRLIAPDGKSLQFDGGRNGTRPDEEVSPLILPGKSLIISRQAKLSWRKDRKTLRLMGSDDFGGIWYFDAIGPGRYKVQVVCENQRPHTQDGYALWTGNAATPTVEVVIR
jgi:hypothetical protein